MGWGSGDMYIENFMFVKWQSDSPVVCPILGKSFHIQKVKSLLLPYNLILAAELMGHEVAFSRVEP